MAVRGHGLFSALLLSVAIPPLAIAGPDGGQVIGGSGSIVHTENTTTINQRSQNMAIDWQSYDVNANERVQYIQPNSSSISLNRILSQSGSSIAGRIDANGQVILVNPNGVFFTPTAIVNVGGIIASGLDIQPNDFMNGRYIFDEVLGTEGTVINHGMINASLGGNVALIGKQVENDGLIVANLGSVTLAAGKQAVLTFDQGGLLGVRVSQEILQDELGVDPAVINSGEIQAEGGRILLSASTSRDVFSQAVNTGGLEQATSVVVHEDGSFTLGGGADVINSGSIDTSTTANDQDAGRIVLIGENVTSRGELRADAANGDGGGIELHAQDTALLTGDSMTSVRSEREGRGGTVKVLGDNVGLFDRSVVNASGAHGGGRVFIGGDQEGNNPLIPNAEFIYLSEDSQVFADALDNGDGGRLITFAADTARIYGDLFARGGINGGGGGFIETSGLIGFQIAGAPDASSYQGEAGTWLIDPYNITVTNSRNNASTSSPFIPGGEDARIDVNDIRDALLGTDVIIRTRGEAGMGRGDITFDKDGDLDYNDTGTTRTLTLDAAGDITFEAGSEIFDGGSNSQDSLNIELLAAGAVILEGAVGGQVAASITTQGGDFVVGDPGNNMIPTSFTNNGTITTTGAENQDGGAITIDTSGTLTSTGLTANGGAAGNNSIGQAAGAVTLNAGTGITLTGPVTATGSQGDHGYGSGTGGAVLMTSAIGAIDIQTGIDVSGGHGDGDNDNHPASGGDAGSVSITADNGAVTVNTITANGGDSAGDDSDNSRRAGNGGTITISGREITLTNNLSSIGGADNEANAGNGAAITLDGPVILENSIILDTRGAIRGDIDFNGTLDGTTARAEDLTLYGRGITFSGLAGSGTRLGNLVMDATGAVDADAHSIVAHSLAVNQSTAFTSGTIDTANAGNTGGNIAITADQITLNDDLDASGASDGTVALTLSSAGSVTLARTTDFTSAVTLTGSTGTDTLTAANRPNNWSLSATDSVLNGNFTFSGIETLIGNAQADDFILPDSGEFSGTLYGGGGADEIQAGNRVNTWNINGDGVGAVTGLNNGFNEIETLTGGNAEDTFNINNDFSGTINAGAGTSNNAFNFQSGLTGTTFSGTVNGGQGDDTFTLTGTNISFANTLDGGAGSNDVLVAANEANYWLIDGAESGGIYTSANDRLPTPSNPRLRFSGIENLTGNAGIDDFLMSAMGSVLQIVGGSGAEIDTLGGMDAANTWQITTDGGGTLTSTASTTTFSQMEILTGGTEVDSFTVDSGSSIATLNGQAGDDQFIVNGSVTTLNAGDDLDTIDVNAGGTVTTLNGNAGIDTITISGADTTNTGNVGRLNGGAGNDVITVASNGRVTTALNGNGGGDVITVNGTAASVNAGEGNDTIIVTHADTVSGVIAGGAGTDELTLTDNSVTLVLDTDVQQIETIMAVGGGANTLTGADAGNTWNISGSGNTVTDTAGGGTATLFSGFSVLNAGTDGDSFEITALGITTINGNTGRDRITLASPGLVATINGGGNTDSLAISTGNNLWAVDANNDGSVKDIETLLNVTGFTSIETRIGSVDGTNNIDLSAFGTETVLLAGYRNFDLLIGSGAGTLQGIDGQQNDWRIQTVADAPAIGTAGVDDGTVTVDLVTTRFINFRNLTGGNAGDTFTLAASGSLTGTINGGGGSNTLTGADVTNTWDITGRDSGSLAYTTTASTTTLFSGIQNITGGTSNDTFSFQSGGSLSGQLDGAGGTDRVDMSALVAVDITLGQGLANIEQITGNNTNSVLRGTNTANTFTLTGANTGRLGDALTFIGFNALDGGDGNDTFIFETMGSLSGPLDGGAGRDHVDQSALAVVDVTLGQGWVAIEQITGNNSNSILRGTTGANAFILTGANTGRLGDALTFIGFNALDGGDGNDTFTFETTGSLSGLLDGGAGRDDVNLSALSEVDITLGQGLVAIEQLTGNNSNSILRGTTGANTFTLTGANAGRLGDALTFIGFNALDGGDGNDTFIFETTGSLSGLLDGGAGRDHVDQSALAVVDVTLGQGLVAIEQVTGNNSNSILRGTADANRFTLTGDNDGSLDSLDFVNFTDLDGGDDNDTFTYQTGASLSGRLDGGAGIDSVDMSALAAVAVTLGQGLVNIESIIGNNSNSILRGTNTANAFVLTAANTGRLDDGLTFTGFNALDGGDGDDTFFFQSGGSLSGRLDGGAGHDRVNMSALAVVDVTLGQELLDIEQITGNDSDSTLRGTADVNAFVLTGANTGTLDGSLAFSGFTILNGGGSDDTFIFGADGRLTGLLDGGAGGSDRVDLSRVTDALSITQGRDINNIEILTGNGNSTLIGSAAANAFILSGENSGTLDNTLAFSRVNRLHGGDGDDTFTFQADGRLTGLIDGGAGNDRADMSLASGVLRVIQGEDINNVETLNGNNSNSTLIGSAAANAFILSGANSGRLDDQLTFTGITALDGGAGDDTFVFQPDGRLNGLLAGGSGSDRVDLSQVTRALRITQGSDIDSIETLIGNNNGTLIGTTAANAFVLSGENAGILDNNLAFSDFNQLDGGAGDDTFTFGANGRLTGLIEGGTGNDRVDLFRVSGALRVTQGTDINNIETLIGNNNGSLIGTAGENAFVLSDENTGTLDSNLSFTGFSQLNGGDGDDTFTFDANGRLTGLLEGGAGNDRADLSQVTRVLRITQGSDINNIEILTGNNNGTLIGTTAANAFVLSDENTGRLDEQLAFSNFNQLDGGDGDDTFTFESNGWLSGLLEGGAGNDHVDMSALASVDIALGPDVVSIEQLTGNNSNSTLRGENNANTWILSDENSGSVDGVVFSGFTTLRGGNGDDRFSQGGFSGAIYGGDHVTGDTIDYSNQATVNVSVDDALAGSASIIDEIEGIRGNGTDSTLTGNTDNRNWFIDGENDGRVGSLVFEDFNNLVGSDGDDTFTFTASGRLSGLLNGGVGIDHVDLSALDMVDIRLGRDVINIEEITGNNSVSTLRGENTNNTWMITGLNSGNITADGGPTLAFSGF
ncbi:MAG: filamentous hemagglutinin N-terminal domain-containing protein, partial [Gammaproteobacteria bacterium]|nr:filamentous hemagglutinin N-terminal domain-containing protein [Gammaproteobacteria bacterium]